jgi:hypothetical protein
LELVILPFERVHGFARREKRIKVLLAKVVVGKGRIAYADFEVFTETRGRRLGLIIGRGTTELAEGNLRYLGLEVFLFLDSVAI